MNKLDKGFKIILINWNLNCNYNLYNIQIGSISLYKEYIWTNFIPIALLFYYQAQ